MLKVSLIFLTFMATACMLNAQNCPTLENDIDYNGNDISFAYASSVNNCCYLCSLNSLCNSFTFVTASQTCWLKSTVGQNRLNAVGRISGIIQRNVVPVTIAPVVFTFAPPTPTTIGPVTTTTTPVTGTTTKGYGCYVENGINYFGSDFFSTFVSTSSDCCNLCGRTPSCVVWSYLVAERFCYLKNQVPSLANRQNYSTIMSGVVTLR